MSRASPRASTASSPAPLLRAPSGAAGQGRSRGRQPATPALPPSRVQAQNPLRSDLPEQAPGRSAPAQRPAQKRPRGSARPTRPVRVRVRKTMGRRSSRPLARARAQMRVSERALPAPVHPTLPAWGWWARPALLVQVPRPAAATPWRSARQPRPWLAPARPRGHEPRYRARSRRRGAAVRRRRRLAARVTLQRCSPSAQALRRARARDPPTRAAA